jgi:DHA2 family methylenomycin A resistance protein-like MFS transporter
MFCAGFAVFMAASLACGLAPDMGVLVAARAVQGAGAALPGACSLALINHAFSDEAERAARSRNALAAAQASGSSPGRRPE